MRHRILLKILFALVVLVSQHLLAQGNLVINGGFTTDVRGWTLTNGASYYSSYGNPSGSVNLGGTAIQQINGLTPGQLYVVSGDYEGGGGLKNTLINGFGVALDGIFLLETNAPTGNNWYSFSFDYTPTSTSALLSLSAPINETIYGYFIDNIAMYAVPEPSPSCLLLLGSGILIYVCKRKTCYRGRQTAKT
jgi:hypothetical protein